MNRQEFFRECAQSYPETMVSVALFRGYVQDACTTILEKYKGDLAAILRLAPQELKVLPYADPDRLTMEERNDLYLGAKARLADGSELLWAYLYWVRDSKQDPFQHGVQFEISPRESAPNLLEAVDIAVSKPPVSSDSSWQFDPDEGFYIILDDLDQIATFESKLDSLIDKAVAVMKSVKVEDQVPGKQNRRPKPR